MDIDDEIRKLKRRTPDQPLALTETGKLMAAMLDKASVSWVGKIFWDKRFRQLAGFDKLDQLEIDRIFNELIVAPLALFMLTLEAPDIDQPQEFRDYLLLVRDAIPKAHLATLEGYGLEKRHLADYEKLIRMRYEEYRKDKLEARAAMMERKSQEKLLETSDLKDISLVLPVFTVAVGCHHHIVRGRTQGRDLLFKYLMKNLARFYTNYRVAIEGGRVTPFTRFLIFVHQTWNDFLERFGG